MTKNITFSDDEALEYIRNLENPNKVGWDGKVWRTPKQKGYDRNQIAYGLDIREKHNPLVYNYLKSKNRLSDPWLTDKEAKSLMAQTFAQKKDSITKAVAIANGNVSQMGYNRLAGMAYHGHPMKMLLDKDSITGKAYRSEIANGGVDFDNTFDAYYGYGDNAVRFKDRTALDYKYRPLYIINGDTRKIIFPANYTKLQNYEPQWKYDSKSYNTIYPVTGKTETPESLSSWKGAGAPNITPRVPDIQEINNKTLNDPYILTFNRFAAKPIRSPFALDLSLPSLDKLMLINSPLRLLEQYFADALGVSDMTPLWPSLFPRFNNGKLPRFADGDEPADWYSNLNPFNQWMATLYGLTNEQMFDEFTGTSSYPYALESIYGIASKYKPDDTILSIYQEAAIDEDVYNALQKLGYDTKPFGQITSDEWKNVHKLYKEGEDAWKKDNPYKSYATRERYANGKSPIRIKPANRGKLTRLKKRTGKSESELYKTGGPSVRKMITFARNARKWKH